MEIIEHLYNYEFFIKITISIALIIILFFIIINAIIKSLKMKRELYFTNDTSNRKYYINDEYFELMNYYIKLDKKTIDTLKIEMNDLIWQQKIEFINKKIK